MSFTKKLVDKLDAARINKVVIQFWGGGDSGEITDVSAEYVDEATPPPAKVLDDLVREIEDAAYACIDGTGVDWYNGEGGGADLIIFKEDGKWVADVTVSQYTLEQVYGTIYTVGEDEE